MGAHLAGEDEEQARRFGWWPRRSGEEQFRAMLREDEEAWRTGGSRRKLAVRVGGDLVGGCEIRLGDAGSAEVSYWTFPACRGQGYATRAIGLLCRFAFASLGVQKIEAHVEPDNAASRAAAATAGFEETERVDAEGKLVLELRR